MGRREIPVDPAAGPVVEFTEALRELRPRTGTPSHRLLAREAGYSAPALSAAASGAALPSLEVALAYAGACGGRHEEWARLFTAQVLEADTESALPWVATSYVPGSSLDHAVQHHGSPPVQAMWLFVAGLAVALHAVQAAELVHRDLKPSNVLLTTDGPRLIDFGLTRASDATHLTRTGIQVGVPQFMAPEHVLGRPLTFAADIFALGAVIVFAATGQGPFGDGVDAAVLYRVVHQRPDLGGLSGGLHELATACLDKAPVRHPTLPRIIHTCRTQSGGTSPKISRTWLPPAYTAEIQRRSAALPPTEPADPAATR